MNTTDQTKAVEQFRSITNAHHNTARKYLKRNSWNIDRALNDYYSEVKQTSNNANLPNLEVIFEKYKDENEDAILAEGIEQFCNDLQVDPMDPIMIVLSYHMGCRKMCEFLHSDFTSFWTRLNCDSLVSMKQQIELFRKDLEMPELDKVYRYAYDFGRDENQKSLALDMAIALWRLLLEGKFKYLEQWCEFVEARKKSIPRDTWNLLFDFVQNVKPDLSDYDPMGSWPVIIDEFTEYLSEKEKILEGVQIILRSWPVLKTAVDQGFGGSDSQEKALWLEEVVAEELLYYGNEIYEDDIEDFLVQVLGQEFSLFSEDNYTKEVSYLLVQLQKRVSAGDLSYINELRSKLGVTLANASASRVVNDESEDECEYEEESNPSEMNTINEPTKKEPVVDEEGFTLVTRKGRKC